jgi:hypothetical protein
MGEEMAGALPGGTARISANPPRGHWLSVTSLKH